MVAKTPLEIRHKVLNLRSNGWTYSAIAGEVGMTKKGVWNICNPDKYLLELEAVRGTRSEYSAKYRQNNLERKKFTDREWEKRNRHKRSAKEARRRVSKLKSEPLTQTFCERWKIDQMYKESARLTLETGIKHNVDHIVPLLGETVCGLHVSKNLRIITQEENCRKKNKLIQELL